MPLDQSPQRFWIHPKSLSNLPQWHFLISQKECLFSLVTMRVPSPGSGDDLLCHPVAVDYFFLIAFKERSTKANMGKTLGFGRALQLFAVPGRR
ncbi:hypothetical protein Krac_11347 [Ktedonobacter racemifer DSM 44963]|uniref:Uncharacterized protein n=1 Tax=Ktedonobacter racemifer DSM 44963 TaxID=485913 RepID=D6TK22_KTERA|nr:hypothetical protein Krac_11347 [Ktedonobacter racemifer DSM 44963]